MDILQPSDPENPSSRARASYIRRKVKAGSAKPEEIAWLGEFEQKKEPGSRGASAHRRVTFTEEESAATGEGDATVAQVAAAAAMVREEGRREDSLADKGMQAFERANIWLEKLLAFAFQRMQVLEDSHLEMWSKHRDSRIREVDAEIELNKALAEQDGKPDAITELATQLGPVLIAQLGGGKAPKAR
jgi:hypothetical protein